MSVGLDIGSKTIKIVELEKQGAGWALRGAGVVGYSGKSIDSITEQAELVPVADVVRKLHREAKISKKQVGISLPESQVFVRTVRFPLFTDQEIAAAIKWEAEQYIPIPISEAIIEHKIIEKKETSTPGEILVLLVAAPKTVVEKYIKFIRLAGLEVGFAETELLSLVRALGTENQTSVIIDFGARSTDIAIAKNTHLVFVRTIPTAGETFTRAVAQGMGMEYQQAEEYKKTYGFSQELLEGKVKQALEPIMRMVIDEVKKAIHFYQVEEKGDAPSSIVVTGGSAGIPDLIPILTKGLNLEVVVGNPFSRVNLNPEIAKTLANYAPLYSVAVGLAMREE